MVALANFTLEPGLNQCQILNENMIRTWHSFNSATMWFLVFAIFLFVLMAALLWYYFQKNQNEWERIKQKFSLESTRAKMLGSGDGYGSGYG